ncbi:putative LRR receptor-like serine/threonine-protein kinase-like [Capsicum annuum]|nr:putative LRR receptor-like serine/threonine-protein kinase-like [Capsicum annuum]KAF3659688.1 putative LRR receptor-like serine/threonine-protein kinase-like [Capsicum annuum]
MTGVLPAELGNFKKLQQLDLSHSKVTGSVRASIFNISALQLLGLHLNKLSGTLPSNLGRGMPNREQFLYGGNNLSGFVSASISNSSRLRVIDLAGNDFTGSIPESLGNLEYLEVLSLGKNSFFSDSTFSFLASLTNCRNLRVLSFSDNPLDGVLPTPIGNLSNSLLCFEGDGCKLKGVIPQEIGMGSLLMLAVGYVVLRLRKTKKNEFKQMSLRQTGMKEFLIMNLNKPQKDSTKATCLVVGVSAWSTKGYLRMVPFSRQRYSIGNWWVHSKVLSQNRLEIMIDVASAMDYLHKGYSTPVVHCDLKPCNVLLDYEIVGHVSDFGIAKMLGAGEAIVQTRTIATIVYISPSILEVRNVFSCGIHKAVDSNLVNLRDEHVDAKMQCLSSIMKLALRCTLVALGAISMGDTLSTLEKIRVQLVSIQN